MMERELSATFWLTLANAFLPPRGEAFCRALREDLPLDLGELAEALDLPVEGDIAAFLSGIREFPDDLDLLVEYSRLFLQAPIPASLNMTRYVDGSINGPCMDALENAYRLAGIAKRDELKDLPDHLVVQLETLAILESETGPALSAADFANLCLVGALPRWRQVLHEYAPVSPYTALAHIAESAIVRYARPATIEDERARRRAERRADTSLGVWRHCERCGKPFVREKEIQIMAKALEQAGLPSDFLTLCPDCRDPVGGTFRRR